MCIAFPFASAHLWSRLYKHRVVCNHERMLGGCTGLAVRGSLRVRMPISQWDGFGVDADKTTHPAYSRPSFTSVRITRSDWVGSAGHQVSLRLRNNPHCAQPTPATGDSRAIMNACWGGMHWLAVRAARVCECQ